MLLQLLSSLCSMALLREWLLERTNSFPQIHDTLKKKMKTKASVTSMSYMSQPENKIKLMSGKLLQGFPGETNRADGKKNKNSLSLVG